MNLFNKKTLERHVRPSPLPADHLTTLQGWSALIATGRIDGYQERR